MFSRMQSVGGLMALTIMASGYAAQERAMRPSEKKDFSVNWVAHGNAHSNVVQIDAEDIIDTVIAVDSSVTINEDFSSCCDTPDEMRDYTYYGNSESFHDTTEQKYRDALQDRNFSVDWVALGDSDPTILQIESDDISATIIIDGAATVNQVVSSCCESTDETREYYSVPSQDQSGAYTQHIRKLVFKDGADFAIEWQTTSETDPNIIQIMANDITVTVIAHTTVFVDNQGNSSCGITNNPVDTVLESFNQIADAMDEEVGEMEALKEASNYWSKWVACKCALRTVADMIAAKSRQLCELSGIC